MVFPIPEDDYLKDYYADELQYKGGVLASTLISTLEMAD
jgi:hypothetical protein